MLNSPLFTIILLWTLPKPLPLPPPSQPSNSSWCHMVAQPVRVDRTLLLRFSRLLTGRDSILHIATLKT